MLERLDASLKSTSLHWLAQLEAFQRFMGGGSSGPTTRAHKRTVEHFSAYGLTCVRMCPGTVGGETLVTVRFDERVRPSWYVSFCLGVLVMLLAPAVAQSVTFYYVSGTALGTVLMVGLLVYFVSKRASPRAPATLHVLFAFATQSSALWRAWAGTSLSTALAAYWDYVAAYVFVSSAISFYFVYTYLNRGPPPATEGEGYPSASSAAAGPPVGWATRVYFAWLIRFCGLLLILYTTSSVSWSLVIVGNGFAFMLFRDILGRARLAVHRAITQVDLVPYDPFDSGRSHVSTKVSKREFSQLGRSMAENEVVELFTSPAFANYVRRNPAFVHRLAFPSNGETRSPRHTAAQNEDTGGDEDVY